MFGKISQNLIPLSIIVAGLLIAGAIIWATMIYVKGIEKPTGLLEEAGPAAVVQPEESKEEPKEEPQTEGEPSVENFAKCLSEKGWKFYGTYWCGYCKKQKELFGDSMKYINYIECADKETGGVTAECRAEGILVPGGLGVPTWKFPDGEKEPSLKSLEKLAELSGCPL